MAKLEPFGQIAIKMGFCNQTDVDTALEIQGKLGQEGKEHRLIGLILLETGALSTTQLIEILQYYEHSGRVPSLEDDISQN